MFYRSQQQLYPPLHLTQNKHINTENVAKSLNFPVEYKKFKIEALYHQEHMSRPKGGEGASIYVSDMLGKVH